MSHFHEKLRSFFPTHTVVDHDHDHDHIIIRVTIATLVHAQLKPWKYSPPVDVLRCNIISQQYIEEPCSIVYAAFFDDASNALTVYKGYDTLVALRLVEQSGHALENNEATLDILNHVTMREMLDRIEEQKAQSQCENGWC